MKNAERRLKQLLKEKHVTVDQLATVTGKNRATIYRYMSGDIETMPTATMKKIAEYLNVSPGYIMGWTDDPSPNYPFEVYDVDDLKKETGEFPNYSKLLKLFSSLTKDQQDTILAMMEALVARNTK